MAMVINNMANTDDHVFRDSSSLLIPDRSRFEGVGMIPFFGSNGSTDVHVTTSGSAVSGMGLYFADDGDDQNIFLTPCGCRCRLIGSLTRPVVQPFTTSSEMWPSSRETGCAATG